VRDEESEEANETEHNEKEKVREQKVSIAC
jgi:hypothetical protein